MYRFVCNAVTYHFVMYCSVMYRFMGFTVMLCTICNALFCETRWGVGGGDDRPPFVVIPPSSILVTKPGKCTRREYAASTGQAASNTRRPWGAVVLHSLDNLSHGRFLYLVSQEKVGGQGANINF